MVTKVSDSMRRVATTIAEIEGLTGITGGIAVLNSSNFGTFSWDASDLSTEVTNDPNQYNFIAPSSDATGASGAWKRVGAIDTYSDTTSLEGVSNAINTAGKVEGKVVKNVTTGFLVVASGAAAGDAWNLLTGTAAHTPV